MLLHLNIQNENLIGGRHIFSMFCCHGSYRKTGACLSENACFIKNIIVLNDKVPSPHIMSHNIINAVLCQKKFSMWPYQHIWK